MDRQIGEYIKERMFEKECVYAFEWIIHDAKGSESQLVINNLIAVMFS